MNVQTKECVHIRSNKPGSMRQSHVILHAFSTPAPRSDLDETSHLCAVWSHLCAVCAGELMAVLQRVAP